MKKEAKRPPVLVRRPLCDEVQGLCGLDIESDAFAVVMCQLVLDPSVLLEILTHTQNFFAWNKLEIFGFLPRPPKLCF